MASLQSILVRAQQGDVVAVRQIIEEFSAVIDGECSRFGLWELPDWSHSDLNQEVVFRVLNKLDQFKGGGTTNVKAVFEQWVRVTSRNVVKNLIRNQTTSARSPEGPVKRFDELTQAFFANRAENKTPSSIFVHEEQAEIIQKLIQECLDEEAKEILILRVVEGLSLTEISRRLPLTYEQVRYKFNQSLVELRTRLGDQL